MIDFSSADLTDGSSVQSCSFLTVMRDKARSAKHPEAETILVPPKQNRWLNALLATTALVSAFAIAMPSSAAEFQWEGGTSDDWSDGSNWIGGNAPGANDHVVVDTNSPNFPVIDATNVELTYTGADLGRVDEFEQA